MTSFLHGGNLETWKRATQSLLYSKLWAARRMLPLWVRTQELGSTQPRAYTPAQPTMRFTLASPPQNSSCLESASPKSVACEPTKRSYLSRISSLVSFPSASESDSLIRCFASASDGSKSSGMIHARTWNHSMTFWTSSFAASTRLMPIAKR